MFPLVCADLAHAGRVDPSFLSDQQMMECFLTPASNAEAALCLYNNNQDNACYREGLNCNAAGRITTIGWHSIYVTLEGSVNFSMAPRALVQLAMYEQKLTGTVDMTNLPERLALFSLELCLFTGTLDLGGLPDTLVTFESIRNRITGVVNISNLPPQLDRVILRERGTVGNKLHIGQLRGCSADISIDYIRAVDVSFDDESNRRSVRFLAH